MATTRKEGEHDSPYWYDDQASFMPDFDPTRRISPPFASYPPHHHTCKQELQMQYKMPNNVDAFLQLPDLESPKLQQSGSSVISCHSIVPYGLQDVDHIQEIDQMHCNTLYINVNNEQAASDQVTDWRVLDKFVASQLSQDDGNDSNEGCVQVSESMGMMENEMKAELTSISTTTTSQFDLWK
ncbi:NAC domain-containing protein 7 [Sesamum angolense]|uniref:NAC domain-containing protein 7 n=1 Tax=Sesamum angolense TaxID=2727404 RepID=A0AAE1WW55_9LAMI|nr:NAC domain-containing protein 7 [Sesamum angolense]